MAETAEIRQKLGRDVFDHQQLTACLSHLSKPRDEIAATALRLDHEPKQEGPRRELFHLQADPAEKNNLLEQQPAIAQKLQTQLRAWQDSVLHSLTGRDYAR